MKYWRGFLVAGILAAITLGLQWLAKRFTQLVDMVYPFLTREIQGFLAGWSGNVDFTVWQVLVMLIVAVLAASIVLMIVLKWNFFQWMGWILAGASMIWLLHTGIYGLNYYASPLSQDIRMGDYSAYVQENLEDATLYFLSQANELAKEMPRDEQGNLQTGTFQELAEKAGPTLLLEAVVSGDSRAYRCEHQHGVGTHALCAYQPAQNDQGEKYCVKLTSLHNKLFRGALYRQTIIKITACL